MNIKEKDNKKVDIFVIVCLVFLVMTYSLLQGVIAYINMHPGLYLTFGSAAIPANNIPGVIELFQISLCVLCVLVDHKVGKYVAYTLITVNIVVILRRIMVDGSYAPLPGAFMGIGGYFILAMIVNQIKKDETYLKHFEMQAITDELTGLANRRGIINFINKKLKAKESFYLLFLDIDNFKGINDSLGHNIGDEILGEIAKRWKDIPNAGGLVGRTGGDEFAIIVADNGTKDIGEFADKCMEALSKEIKLGSFVQPYRGAACVGISHYPTSGSSCTELLRCADTALYAAKDAGTNKWALFSEEMDNKVKEEHELEACMREALDNNRFNFVFQPQFEAADKKLIGFEALIRMNNEAGDPVSPAKFIPIAERSSLIFDIDLYVLRKTTAMTKEIINASGNKLILSVNISANHFVEKSFANNVRAIIEEVDFPAECLEIEITEYCFAKDIESAIRTINEIKKLGVKIALDDFGTGYASIGYLSKFSVDVLKIDKSFVDNIASKRDDREFINLVILLGHTLGCKVISEGVEDEEQLQILKDYSCDYIQGYVWSKPISMLELKALANK